MFVYRVDLDLVAICVCSKTRLWHVHDLLLPPKLTPWLNGFEKKKKMNVMFRH